VTNSSSNKREYKKYWRCSWDVEDCKAQYQLECYRTDMFSLCNNLIFLGGLPVLVGYQANSQCIPVYNKAYFMPMNVFTSSVVVNANRENYEVNDKLITLNQKNKI